MHSTSYESGTFARHWRLCSPQEQPRAAKSSTGVCWATLSLDSCVVPLSIAAVSSSSSPVARKCVASQLQVACKTLARRLQLASQIDPPKVEKSSPGERERGKQKLRSQCPDLIFQKPFRAFHVFPAFPPSAHLINLYQGKLCT